MSISVNRYFGWTIDLKTNLDCNDFDFYDEFINKHPDLEERGNCMPNKIKLVLDGMNGTFARLVYVLAVSYDVAWVDEDNDILNDNLKENVVPENVLKELNTVYMQLTGQELQKENVKLKEWHLWDNPAKRDAREVNYVIGKRSNYT